MSEKTTFKEVLERTGHLAYTNKGVSMMPLLRHDRDVMLIDKKEEGQLKLYDAVLFIRDNGQYVLHRILKVRDNDYWIVGDNCVGGEYVREDQIIGVLTAVLRDGKQVNVTDPGYRFYVWLWCRFYPVRFKVLKCKNFARRALGMVKRAIKWMTKK